MPYPPESRKPSTEAEVLDGARCYANARRWSEVLHRKQTLAVEAERLADCDLHDASNERLNANLEAGDRAMGFTTPVDPPSEVGGVDDHQTGKALLVGSRIAHFIAQNAHHRTDTDLLDRHTSLNPRALGV